ncbi:hypothetical protein PRIPAC_71082 [Pristionchus pacificus]|nr:hypothetical protein PRIPAC_71082 [Pristionchus pacificus]
MAVREATAADVPHLMGMIRELAEYEKMPSSVKIDEATLARDLARGAYGGFVVVDDETKEVAGMLLYYLPYSTWIGQFMHMEDLYVRPAYRRKGYGKVLWRAAAQLSRDRGYVRFQWDVLNWNTPAINFYKKCPGAVDLTEKEGWLKYRLDADGIAMMADSTD